MYGTNYIIQGDNEKVHAWFTEHDRLCECHCDACFAARNAEHKARIIRDIKSEKNEEWITLGKVIALFAGGVGVLLGVSYLFTLVVGHNVIS